MKRDPRRDPRFGGVFHKWAQNFLINGVNQGCVFVSPSLSAHRGWIGILHFTEWAKGAEVIHVAE